MKVGDKVFYRFLPHGGYGFSMTLTAEVVVLENHRARVRLRDAFGKARLAWAPLHELSLYPTPAQLRE